MMGTHNYKGTSHYNNREDVHINVASCTEAICRDAQKELNWKGEKSKHMTVLKEGKILHRNL